MAAKVLPPQDVLRQLLEYDPETGRLTWKERGIEWFRDDTHVSAAQRMALWNGCFAGKDAFSALHNGYRHGELLRQKVAAHRVIYKMMTGEDPDVIDHINGDRGDNRWVNLRNVSFKENTQNACISKNNKSGVTGVSWHKLTGKWRATIFQDYRQKYLGVFDNLEDAVAARKAAEREIGFHPNHGRRA